MFSGMTPTVVDQPGCDIRNVNICSLGVLIILQARILKFLDSFIHDMIYLVAAYTLLRCLEGGYPPLI